MERIWDMDLELHTPLQELNIVMYGKRYKMQPGVDLELHPSTIGEDLQNQAARYAFYATALSMANAKAKAVQRKLGAKRSELDAEWRLNGVLPDGNKITEDSVRRALRLDPDVGKLEDSVNAAEFDAQCLSNVVIAFEHRKVMLIELAKRAHNSTFNDQDANITVSAQINVIESARAVGQHPSKK